MFFILFSSLLISFLLRILIFLHIFHSPRTVFPVYIISLSYFILASFTSSYLTICYLSSLYLSLLYFSLLCFTLFYFTSPYSNLLYFILFYLNLIRFLYLFRFCWLYSFLPIISSSFPILYHVHIFQLLSFLILMYTLNLLSQSYKYQHHIGRKATRISYWRSHHSWLP